MEDSQVRLQAVRSFLSQQSGVDELEHQIYSEGNDVEPEYVDDERERLERVRRILAQNQETKSVISPIPKAIQRRSSMPPKTPPPPPFSASSGLTRARRDISTISARDTDSKTSGSASPHENDRPIHENTSAVFDRLYALHKNKKRGQDGQKKNSEFHPKIDKNSRKLALQTERVSLYERALQQRFRQESEREMKDRQEREDRSKPKTLQTSQQMAWNRLRREVEQLFQATIQTVSEGEADAGGDVLMALDRDEFTGVLKYLNLQEANVELYEMLSGEGDKLVHLDTLCSYLKHISFPSSEEDAPKDEFSMKVKRLLVGRKAVPSTASMEKVYREVAVELPFAPQITEKSRQLDEKRYQRMGIDPSLPRSEKIHAELRLQAEKKETNKTVHSKRELEPCTFHPKTNKTSATAYHRPASPPASSEYARKSLDVGSRLYKDSMERDARLMRKKEARQNAALTEEIAECTFRPVINSRPRSQTGTSSKSQENPLRTKAFQMSVERLREWRDKHVTKVDTSDLAYIAKMKQEEAGTRGGVRSSEKPVRTSDSSFLARHRARAVIFEAEVALPNGLTSLVQVRNGDDLVRVAATFAKKHGLDKIEETSLLKSLQVNVPQVSNEEISVMSRDEFIDDQSETPSMFLEQEGAAEEEDQYNEETDCLVLDVLVRPGETYELTISPEDDPVQVAHDFADDVGMEFEARDRLIESLMGLRI